ncbi:MAG: hypothetical protein LBG11_03110, partial [Bifidobacteriaceae bacterium]|nr:hypothetical protein [Bifidobacteriaceae bacterium]
MTSAPPARAKHLVKPASGVAADEPAKTEPQIQIGGSFTVGRLSEGVILGLAAVTSAGSEDPVDQALVRALAEERPDLVKPPVDPADIDPATPRHRYSLTMVRYFPLEEDKRSDVIVMRGALEAVLAKSTVSRRDKALLRRNGAWA